jgi:hypothetical protein
MISDTESSQVVIVHFPTNWEVDSPTCGFSSVHDLRQIRSELAVLESAFIHIA